MTSRPKSTQTKNVYIIGQCCTATVAYSSLSRIKLALMQENYYAFIYSALFGFEWLQFLSNSFLAFSVELRISLNVTLFRRRTSKDGQTPKKTSQTIRAAQCKWI